MEEGIIYLTAGFRDKDKVKALGARWDPSRKSWYAPGGADLTLFRPWLPADFDAIGELLPMRPSFGVEVDFVKGKGIQLSQLLAGVAQAVAEAYSSSVWTMVDVVDARIKSGHVYLEVAERDANGDVIAKAVAIIWASKADRMLPEFERATGAKVGPGIKLLLKVTPVFVPRFGLSLQVVSIDPDYTLGDLEARKREIRNQLQREGIYGLNKDFPPAWDFNAVLVIAPQGAAGLGDFQAEASRLEAAGICRFVYVHSRFQGEGAASAIRTSLLQALDEWEGDFPDAAVIIRGGGAVNDLAWLNDYELARCICEAPLPVLTGIGHERDSTILDEVAHTKFDTPSKVIHAIETVIRQRALQAKEFYQAVTSSAHGITQRCRLTVEGAHVQVKEAARQQLAGASRLADADIGTVRLGALKALRSATDESQAMFAAIEAQARRHVAEARLVLPSLIESIKSEARSSVRDARVVAEQVMLTTIERATGSAATAKEQANRAMSGIAVDARRAIHEAAMSAEAMVREIAGQGPEKTLSRGFAMVSDENGRAITSATRALAGQHIKVQFRDGSVNAVVNGGSKS